MSLFSKAVSTFFVPAVMHWHADSILYLEQGASPVEVEKALVGEEKKRNSDEEYDERETVERSFQFVVDSNSDSYSGVPDPKENGVIQITENGSEKQYVVLTVTGVDGGKVELKTKRTSRIQLGSKEVRGG